MQKTDALRRARYFVMITLDLFAIIPCVETLDAECKTMNKNRISCYYSTADG